MIKNQILDPNLACLIQIWVPKFFLPGFTSSSTGFDLTTHDSYFTILVEVFMNHILAENTYFTNDVERTEQDYVKTCT